MSSLIKALAFILPLLLLACHFPETNNKRALLRVEDISKKLDKGEMLQLIDVRTEDEYLHSHIKGARNIWRRDMTEANADVEGLRLNKIEFELMMSSFGISDNDSIYLYDANGNVDAARLWWILNLYGFEKVALIDGGFVQWRMKGYPVFEGEEVFKPSLFKFTGKEQSELLASKYQVYNQEYEQLIDARSLDEYTGEVTKNGAYRAGHIPGAVRFDYVDMLNGGAFTFKSKEKLLRLLDAKGLDPDKKTITYCHSGVRSALTLFVLKEIVGMKHVSNYDGSWIEWSEDEELPIEKN